VAAQDANSADGPVAAVGRYIDAFNKGDVDAMAECFAPSATILDGMAPHVWHGASAARDWHRDVLIEGEHAGAGDYRVSIGAPLHADITGDAAYVVLPATMTFKVRGQPVTQTGAVYTVALRRIGGEWRIAAWAWAKGQRAT
jgi:ketosteroid isomerase-like protein